MFINEEEAQIRLTSGLPLVESHQNESHQIESHQNKPNLSVIAHKFRGRTKGRKNVPEFLRPVIAAAGELSGIEETAKAFELSRPSVSTMKHGKVTYCDTTRENKEMKSKTELILDKVNENAADRILKSISYITDEKLENSKVSDLSTVAANMARIIEKTNPKKQEAQVGTQILIYAPSLKQENQFEIVED